MSLLSTHSTNALIPSYQPFLHKKENKKIEKLIKNSELVGEPSGGTILKSLIHVDNLGAQRHLTDPNPDASGRSEDLIKVSEPLLQAQPKSETG